MTHSQRSPNARVCQGAQPAGRQPKRHVCARVCRAHRYQPKRHAFPYSFSSIVIKVFKKLLMMMIIIIVIIIIIIISFNFTFQIKSMIVF